MKQRRSVTIVDAIKDKWLFGSLFPDLTSWSSWVVFLKAVFGIEMDAKELELYRACTKRSEPPKFGAKESYAIVGPVAVSRGSFPLPQSISLHFSTSKNT